MPTYRLFVSDDKGGASIAIDPQVIDQSPVLKAIVERAFVDNVLTDANAYNQNYSQRPDHDRVVHDRKSSEPGPHSKSYSRAL